MKRLAFIIILLALTGFKRREYKIVNKEIDGRTFYFAIPNSFCEHKNETPEIMEFVKCYEIEMEENRFLPFYSERILIWFEKDDKRIQNITDSYFAKIQKESYGNMSKEDKEQYFYNENYSFKNKAKSRIVDDKYIFSRTASTEDGYKFITYQSNLFLNKRYFMINWTQYLTKNEKPLELTEKKFVNFVEENRRLNDYKDSLYKYPLRQIIITKPRFGNFANYTDLKEYNGGSFNGIFITLLNKKDGERVLIFKTSMAYENISTKEVFELLSKENEEKKKEKLYIKLITYKNDDFIKVIKDDIVMYMAYINFSNNMTGIVSLELPKKEMDEKDNYVKYLYDYKKQLIEDNL